jgi:hypothetical protein
VLKGLGEEGLEPLGIQELLRKHAPHRMPKEIVADYGSPEFFVHVDGANLLKDVFNEASDTRHSYRKVRDGLELLKIILRDDRPSVNELVEYVNGLLSQQRNQRELG